MAYEHCLLNMQRLGDALSCLTPKARHLAWEVHLAAWRSTHHDRMPLTAVYQLGRGLSMRVTPALIDELIDAGLVVLEGDVLVVPSLTAERDRQAAKIAHNRTIAPRGVAARRAKRGRAAVPPPTDAPSDEGAPAAVPTPAGTHSGTAAHDAREAAPTDAATRGVPQRDTRRDTPRATHRVTHRVIHAVTLGGSTSPNERGSVPEPVLSLGEVQPSGYGAPPASAESPAKKCEAEGATLGAWRAALEEPSSPRRALRPPIDDLGSLHDADASAGACA